MARRPRLTIPGAVYHVMSRGNRKSVIFEDDEDRHVFLRLIAEAATRYAVRFYALCLMSNHYHCVMDTPRDNLSDAMRHINGVYSQRSNRRYKRTGHVFEARFRSLIVHRETYLRRVTRYVVLNPVRARLVEDAAAWQWSTYRATAGLEPTPDWLYTEWLTWAFRADTLEAAQACYVDYVHTPSQKTIDLCALVLGSNAFKHAITERAQRQEDRLLPHDCEPAPPPPLEVCFAPPSDDTVDRATLIAAAHITHGYRFATIAAHLRLTPNAVSKAFRRHVTRAQHVEAVAFALPTTAASLGRPP